MSRTEAVNLWLPILTLILGFFLSMVAEIVRDHRQAARETRTREAERERERADRRDDFQIRTLLEVQEAAQELAKTSEHLFVNLELGANDDPELRAANVDALKLLNEVEVRVLDGELRSLIGEFCRAAAEARDPANWLLASLKGRGHPHERVRPRLPCSWR